MEQPRKRSLPEDEDSSSSKKRVLSGPDGSPHVNGLSIEEEEPTEGDNLELFRKEAIFRRMRHYSREHERSQSRVAALERRRYTYEAALAAMAACWKELVKTVHLLVNSEEMPEITDDILDIPANFQVEGLLESEFAKMLEDRLSATRAFIMTLMQGSGQMHAHVSDGSILLQCQKATSRCIALQSQVDAMHFRIKESEGQKEEYHRALVMAESRLDRFHSKTVMAMQSRAAKKKEEAEDFSGELQRKPSSPAGLNSPVLINGTSDPAELHLLREHLTSREARIYELEREAALIHENKMRMEAEAVSIPYEKIIENAHYKGLQEHAGRLQTSLTESFLKITRLTEDFEGLRASRKEWEEAVLSAAAQANQELKSMLNKRDTENARLREQREQQAAELNERRMQDSLKFTALREQEVLADSRSERITVLESEVSRCKAQLAANAGHEELLSFFMNGNTDEVAFFKNMKDRLFIAEGRVAALEQSLMRYQVDYPDQAQDIEVEVDIRQRLMRTEAELVKYKSIYGDPSSLPLDASVLAEQLRHKEEELRRLQLLNVQHNQAQSSLYTELDKLSAAWESLDRQAKDKVFDLSTAETQLKKALSEKAKSDNKYFAAMRDKDAIAAESQKLQREQEKQNKVIEHLRDVEKSLNSQLGTLEKEFALLRKAHVSYKQRVEFLSEDVSQWIGRTDAEKRANYEMSSSFQKGAKANAEREAELRKLGDELLRSKKELELKQEQKLLDLDAGSNQDEEKQHLMSLLKCSICKAEFRNTVITKCMHTFCRACVDARISTRQRRCPACSLPFSQSDVLYGLYFQ